MYRCDRAEQPGTEFPTCRSGKNFPRIRRTCCSTACTVSRRKNSNTAPALADEALDLFTGPVEGSDELRQLCV